MKLSHAIHKGIIETTVGSLFNKFKIKRRRDTMFFDDIVLNYFKLCKREGYEEEMRGIVERWMIIYSSSFLPKIFKKAKQVFFFNKAFKKVWINLGYMDDITLTKKGGELIIETLNERHVKEIGLNALSIGGYQGFLSALFEKKILFKSAKIKGNKTIYKYKLTDKEIEIKHKSKEEYLKKNDIPKMEGFCLRDALKMKVFQIKENNIYFRGKKVSPLENTLFHLISNKKILTKQITKLSYDYFKKFKIQGGKEGKLKLLKTLLQVMGWGIVKIASKEKEIIIKIEHPPHGLQLEKDNWTFLIKAIEGYLKVINKKIRVEKQEYKSDNLKLTYVY